MSELKDRVAKLLELKTSYAQGGSFEPAEEVVQLIKDQQARIDELEASRTQTHGLRLGKSASGALTFYQKCLEAKDGDKIAICTTDRNIILTISIEHKSGVVALENPSEQLAKGDL